MLVSVFVNAQKSTVNRLLMINDYLSEIRTTVNTKNLQKQQLQKLEILIKEASAKEKQFRSDLKEVIPTESLDYKTMTDSCHLILQSMALYRSDISNNESGLSEKRFLIQNIPLLIDQILYHCKRFEENINFNTH